MLADEPFALKPDDTVVFYGDSITEQRMYSRLTELFVVSRYPKLNVTFVHSGWGGDRVTGGGGGPIDTRLSRDVIAYHPTVMTIMLGMNDGNSASHKEADDTTFYNGYHHIVDTMRKAIPNLRLTLIGPSPYDDATRPITLYPNGYNAVMVQYGEYLKKYAAESGAGFADLNTGVVAMLRKAMMTDPVLAKKIIPDRVHPSLGGHLIMAEQLLTAWHARPVVSSVTLDASGKVAESQFTAVTAVHGGLPLSWSQMDESLPLPLAQLVAADKDKTLGLAIRSSDVAEALNLQPMRVTGLAVGHYKLSIDGTPVGEFSEAELGQGVNLGLYDRPMTRQAMTVHDLTVKRIDLHHQAWRTIQVPLAGMDLKDMDTAWKTLADLDMEIAAKQRQAAQPVAHQFQVSPAQ